MKRRAAALAALGIFLLVALSYWRLALPGAKYIWFDHYDMCQLEVPRLQFLARSLQHGNFPLWDPHTWAGQPMVGTNQPGALYPLNLAFLAAAAHDGIVSFGTLNWWFIAIHFVAAIGAYLFCRDQGLGGLACAIGGFVFSCAGYVGSLPWLDLANGASLTPFVFLFLFRIWRMERLRQSSALLGASLGLSWLSGHHEIPLINTYSVLLGTACLLCIRGVKGRGWDFRIAASVAGAVVLAVAISAVQTMPVYEFGQVAKRWVGAAEPIGWAEKVPYEVHRQYSLPWKGLAGLVVPVATPESHTMAFLGVTAVGLATVGLRYGWAYPWLPWIASIGLGSLLYVLGPQTPFHRLLYLALPMVDKARTPVRGLFLLSFAISVLAALGAHIVLTRSPRKIIGGVLLALVFFESSLVVSRRVTPFTPSSVCANDLVAHRAAAESLWADPRTGRIMVDRQQLMTNLGLLYGLDQLQGFVAAVPANLLRHEFHTERTQQLFGVTHDIGKGGVAALRARTAFPRAWISHRTLLVRSDDELKAAVQNPAMDLRRTAIVMSEAPPLAECEGAENVDVRRPDSDSVVLTATLGCRGLLVLSDTNYPGWKAAIDGRPAVIHEVYGAFRGIVVEAGSHTVTMRYQPASILLGAGISGLGVLMTIVLLLRR